MGRRNNIPTEKRLCKYCTDSRVEDEKHFLIVRLKYNTLRNDLWNSISTISNGKWNFHMKPIDEVFSILMQGSGDQYELKIHEALHKFLQQCIKLREKHIT